MEAGAHHLLELGYGVLGEEVEADAGDGCGEDRGGVGVADDGAGLIEAGGPAVERGVAEHQCVGFEAGGDEHDLGEGEEGRPAGGYSYEGVVGGGEPGREKLRDGADLQDEHCYFGREDGAQCFGFAGEDENEGAGELGGHRGDGFGVAGAREVGEADGEAGGEFDGLVKLLLDDAAEFHVGLDEEKAGGGSGVEVAEDAGAELVAGHVGGAGGLDEVGDELVEVEGGTDAGDGLRRGVADEDAAAAAELHPGFAFELAVAGADGVGVDLELLREGADAGQALARREVAGQDSEGDLGDDLVMKGDVSRMDEPESHAPA